MSSERDAGKLDVTVTYLQMPRRPDGPSVPPPAEGLLILQARRPTISFYRYLYNTVGEPWLWVDRRKLDDAALAAIVQHEQVEVHVLYKDGVPAGYFELDLRQWPDLELAYFGLLPEFIGQRLGPYLLDQAIRMAWSRNPGRLTLNTCTLDHPKALQVYQRAGFVPYRSEHKLVEDPRQAGLLGQGERHVA